LEGEVWLRVNYDEEVEVLYGYMLGREEEQKEKEPED
jgi:hypothetical protein